MSSKFSNKYPIPEKFPEILHDFSREVLRYMPKDILDFSIQYFYSLETNTPLNYIEGGSNKIPKSSETIEIEKSKRKELSTPSLTTNQNTQNVFYNKEEKIEKKLEDEKEEIKELKETNSSKMNSPLNTEEKEEKEEEIDDSIHSKGSGVVRASINFVNDIFDISQQKLQSLNLYSNKMEEKTDNDNRFNLSGHTFSDISGKTEDKNAARNFVGDVFNEFKKNTN